MKHLQLLLIALFACSAWAAADLTGEMDALGANKDLMKKARAVDPRNTVRVVQTREVSRTNRLEVGLDYGMAMGGDPYVTSDVVGAQVNFHFTPRFSIGARYYDISNKLNGEGKSVFDQAYDRRQNGDTNFRDPAVAYASDAWLTVLNWYPIYGKMSLFDNTISQFDLYLLGGGGQINLDSGTSTLITAGAGAGIWLTQHLSTRIEARWQGYKDVPGQRYGYTDSRDINQTIISASVGALF